MTFRPTAKILNDLESELTKVDFYRHILATCDFAQFERMLYQRITQFFEDLILLIMNEFCDSPLFKALVYQQKSIHIQKIKKRSFLLILCTGTQLKLPGFYADKVDDSYQGERHLFHSLMGTHAGLSPAYVSHVSKLAVTCPSFDIAQYLSQELGLKANTNQIRNISLQLGQRCLEDRVRLQLRPNESLEGKLVVISVDGARTRTRMYKSEKNEKQTHHLYHTPWVEPKLLVIQVIDPSTGKMDQESLPIYDCTFTDVACFELITSYLKQLQIEKAKHVQFIADGAQWIWNNARNILHELGVKEENITETLDYYHAVEHLGVLVDHLPKSVKNESSTIYAQLKEKLWNGDISGIVTKVREISKSKNKDLSRELNYFEKHKKSL